jgi:hypothetical protein
MEKSGVMYEKCRLLIYVSWQNPSAGRYSYARIVTTERQDERQCGVTVGMILDRKHYVLCCLDFKI